MIGEQFYKLPTELANRADLSASAKLVWSYLHYRQGTNGTCWPGLRRIANDLGLRSPSAVAKCIKQLEIAGLVEVKRGKPNRKGEEKQTNHYTIKRAPERTSTVENVLHREHERPPQSTEKNQGKEKVYNIARFGKEAKALLAKYAEIKPPRHDTSRHQGKRNIISLLRSGRTVDELERAARNYGQFCESSNRGYEYRKNAGNFFGRDAVYEQFIDWQPDGEGLGLPGVLHIRAPTDEDLRVAEGIS